ncbi:BgTH12-01156 [Blumeria graminis f. sp. triticale]|uniref:Bgt-48 n=3 Tax=Blumeria graminis TaxID=34373 RepID=A0A061HLR6_BLUGR|nr:hypothetical protein BGT96224_48 [Blumeria graminis f. sp. tritici 96224]CAD6505666.1 BgTH12-01156 [Blumeria graminis f. sp. triticale]VDB93823.1 Bgt-48 [Blumeria graminis f. sp. tritici]
MSGGLYILPATTFERRYHSPSASRHRRRLNTIVEDEESTPYLVNISHVDDLNPKNVDAPYSLHTSSLNQDNDFLSETISPFLESLNAANMGLPNPSEPWLGTGLTVDNFKFEDLYDVSSDEEIRRKRRRPTHKKHTPNPQNPSLPLINSGSRATRPKLPALITSSDDDHQRPEFAGYMKRSPQVLSKPKSMIQMSPKFFSYQQTYNVPSCSTPPSLDGSQASEQLTRFSTPTTPNSDSSQSDGEKWDHGVQLHPAALATLQSFSATDQVYKRAQTQQLSPILEAPKSPESSRLSTSTMMAALRRDQILQSSEQWASLDMCMQLNTPSSPVDFCLESLSNIKYSLQAESPSSAIAERFYKSPWILNTAYNISGTQENFPHIANADINNHEVKISELGQVRFDELQDLIAPNNNNKLEKINHTDISILAEKSDDDVVAEIDRTSMWVASQCSLISNESSPIIQEKETLGSTCLTASTGLKEEEPEVDFLSGSPITKASRSLAKTDPLESVYYNTFRNLYSRASDMDIFVHRKPRFEAIQSQRVSFPTRHCAQVLGKYEFNIESKGTKYRLSSNVARGDEIFHDEEEDWIARKKQKVFEQILPATWNLMAIKFLNGGRFLAEPISQHLACRLSMRLKYDGLFDRAHILDLGGQAICDWAWICAAEYSEARVYTITTKTLHHFANTHIRGPPNHRYFAVDRLVRLPFQDNHFDLISARDIHTILKFRAKGDENEWEACLKECMRVLKPGGYLEFNIMDSNIVNGGPLGCAKSLEFGHNLEVFGYDPQPTKKWLQRLEHAGFSEIKRGWLFLPMGPQRDSAGVFGKSSDEVTHSGSTQDIASISGLVGAWAWEKWLLRYKLQTNCVDGNFAGVQDIIQEGSKCGAGWWCIQGWARKPMDRV